MGSFNFNLQLNTNALCLWETNFVEVFKKKAATNGASFKWQNIIYVWGSGVSVCDTGFSFRRFCIESPVKMFAGFFFMDSNCKLPQLKTLLECERYQLWPMFTCRTPLLTMVLVVTLSSRIIQWMSPAQKWIVCPCLHGQRPQTLTRPYVETLETNNICVYLFVHQLPILTWCTKIGSLNFPDVSTYNSYHSVSMTCIS